MINKKIKIPVDVKAFYCDKNNLLTLIGPRGKKSLQLWFKIAIDKTEKVIVVTPILSLEISRNKIKNIPELLGKQVSVLKEKVLESTLLFFIKLQLVGVGYRALTQNLSVSCQDFKLKLGYSHLLHCKLSNNTNVFISGFTKVTLYGNVRLGILSDAIARIRKQRPPEPYKGKGVLYSNEKVRRKVGKRV